jgi:hypothetical protein
MAVTEIPVLSPAQARVLGALVEKEVTTPEYYPLSLNALINACNQKSNREPVMELDEETVRQALHALEDLGLAGPARFADGRVLKYEHWMGEAFNFSRAETALICVLLLRGPQTPGELRGRTERLNRFDEIGDVLGALQKLTDRAPSLAVQLARQPGMKESRWAHLLSGPVENIASSAPAFAPRQAASTQAASSQISPAYGGAVQSVPDPAIEARVMQLEAELAALRQQVADLNARIDDIFGD